MIRGMVALTAVIAMTSGASAQSAAVKRGSYLVNTIMTCGNCHTPKGPTGDIKEKAFSGFLEFDEPPFKVTASNITPDKETGIGKWTQRADQECAADRNTAERRAARGNHADEFLSNPDDGRRRRHRRPI